MRTELRGLSTSSPISFMAALGLLRVLSEDLRIDARLGWHDGYAVLEGEWGSEALPSLLAKHMQGRAKAPEWNWAPTAKRVKPRDYRAACAACAEDSRALGFMAAFASDAVLTAEGDVRSTRLDLTSGQQQLIRDLKKLAEVLATEKKAVPAFESALFGGPYEEQATFGWDPLAIRKHAYEAKAPMLSTPPGKKGLVWLAAEAFPLHPVLPVRNRARTTGIERIEGIGAVYFWPIWERNAWLTLDEVRMLRALDYSALLRRPGVSECWASEVGQSGKYGILLPAKRVF